MILLWFAEKDINDLMAYAELRSKSMISYVP